MGLIKGDARSLDYSSYGRYIGLRALTMEKNMDATTLLEVQGLASTFDILG